ncbi:MAG TPA: hypothetical protein DC049_01435 [Spirochaetia bacterium]|nr:hypothetical protein [Spirochaetia bacterium]
MIAHSPQAGEDLNPGRDIIFLVSRGIATNDFIIEDYTLKNFKAVRAQLEEFGIAVGIITKYTAQARNAGKIFSQSVEPETKLKKGAKITLTVGVEFENSDENKPREILRVYSMQIPFSSGNNSDVPEQVKIELVITDSLGRGVFSSSGAPGELIDIPYSSTGDGVLEVYINKSFYTKEQIRAGE